MEKCFVIKLGQNAKSLLLFYPPRSVPKEPVVATGGDCKKGDQNLSWLHRQRTWWPACPLCLSDQRERIGKQSPLETEPSCWNPPKRIEQDEVMGYTAVGKSQKKSKDQKQEKSCAATPDLAGAAGLVSNKVDETGVFNGILIPFSSIRVPETCKASIWKGAKEASEPAKYLFLKPMQQCAYFIQESPSRFLFRISCIYFMKLFSQIRLLIQKFGLTSLAQPRRYIIR